MINPILTVISDFSKSLNKKCDTQQRKCKREITVKGNILYLPDTHHCSKENSSNGILRAPQKPNVVGGNAIAERNARTEFGEIL